MGLEIKEVGADSLARLAYIPITFCVETVLQVVPGTDPLQGIRFREERVTTSYMKDYDAYKGEGPTRWPKRWDLRNWGIFLASDGNDDVGGAVVAFDTPGVHMLEDRTDLAVLWDLRVLPDRRRRGVGTRLFRHAAAWARVRGCVSLKIETQNVNVPACRFYARQGCTLGAIQQRQYREPPEVRDEIMLLWYLDLRENMTGKVAKLT